LPFSSKLPFSDTVEQFSIIMGILSESPDGPAERRLTQSISGSEGGCINEEDGREGVKRKGGFWPSIAIYDDDDDDGRGK
jgi:hypothetical protein